ncbi:low affinity immunoglobulin epsilon Fc receptor-like isoform X3 [Leptotrombidium deliense]|uniref:Low affinity immunoglobulin epsilon Fc receptor-like isoform X3 n=1 Tax=Leptotrombidium deliense TaxID=299467 RepID=A0A443S4C0_9ACAR|nr:low affinity immunoglobulin epsilon Fc receptor-like isoform X3 [Leptotrombidium deliense]
MRATFVLSLITNTKMPKLCADDWTLVGNKCIFKNETSADWNENRVNCHAMEASMVKIQSKDENELLINMIKKDKKDAAYYWIGGRVVFIGDKQFEWSDGSPIVYKNWASSEPNNVDHKNGACINIHAEKGEWYDYACDLAGGTKIGQLCEKKIDCTVLHKLDQETRLKYVNYCSQKDTKYVIGEMNNKIDTLRKYLG